MNRIFLIPVTLREHQFHRICLVTEALEYIYTLAAPVPHISGELGTCKIQVSV